MDFFHYASYFAETLRKVAPFVGITSAFINTAIANIFSSIDTNTSVFKYLKIYYIINTVMVTLLALYSDIYTLLIYIFYLPKLYIIFTYVVRIINSIRRGVFILIAFHRFIILRGTSLTTKLKVLLIGLLMVSTLVNLTLLTFDIKNSMMLECHFNQTSCSIIRVYYELNFVKEDFGRRVLDIVENAVFSILILSLTIATLIQVKKNESKTQMKKFKFLPSRSKKSIISILAKRTSNDTHQEQETELNTIGEQLNVKKSTSSQAKVTKLILCLSVIFLIEQLVNLVTASLVNFNFVSKMNRMAIGHKIIEILFLLHDIIFQNLDFIFYFNYNERFSHCLKQKLALKRIIGWLILYILVMILFSVTTSIIDNDMEFILPHERLTKLI